MSRAQQLADISGRLRGQRLIWFGTRGADAAPLLDLEAFGGVVCLIAPLDVTTRPQFSEAALEAISRERVDLDLYRIDDDRSEPVRTLHRMLLALLREDSVLVTYRPCDFLSAAYFPRIGWTRYLGMFAAHGEAYDHKPWVESGLKAAGVPVIPWEYYHDEDLQVLTEVMDGRTFVLRANYSDGGAGLTRVPAGADPREHIPPHGDGFLAAAPMLEPNIPVNVSGCAYPDGTITLRAPSLQLIGIDCCTTREFGYCGNDFAAVFAAIGDAGLDALEHSARKAGEWLHSTGYVGAYGVDALHCDGRIFVTEVNPRFQGCSAVGAAVARRLDVGDVYLDHLGAFLGVDAPRDVAPLREQARDQADTAAALSQVVCHNIQDAVELAEGVVVPDIAMGLISGVPAEAIRVVHEGMLFKLIVDRSVTEDGASVDAETRKIACGLAGSLFTPARRDTFGQL